MPVVNILKSRLRETFPNEKVDNLIEKLPFIGLDIEGMDKEKIRVEYNPNRPDFSSDIGIFRSLKGLINETVGLPILKYSSNRSYNINVDKKIKQIRPIILFFVATKKDYITNFLLNELISIQEDLHNGIARGRKKASIGFHDLDKIKFPLIYTTKPSKESFIPLEQNSSLTFKEILNVTEAGKKYSHLVNKYNQFPALIDDNNQILSFPPIINSNKTKVTNRSKNILIEITGTNLEISKYILAILSFYLYDEGFKLYSGNIHDEKSIFSSLKMIKNKSIIVDNSLINNYLGLNLTTRQIIGLLNKSRFDGKILNKKKIKCLIPPFRNDIIHPTDIVEEVAIGYGIDRLKPTLPLFQISSGSRNSNFNVFSKLRETLIGLGFLEMVNFTLIDSTLFSLTNHKTFENFEKMRVRESKSKEHEFLRTNIIPSLMNNLSYNIHEEYPQKIFEIGKTFSLISGIEENWSLGAIIASNNTNYTEMKSILQSIFKLNFGEEIMTKKNQNELFISGRSADIFFQNEIIGFLGEISPQFISKFNLRLPLSGFELNLSKLLRLLQK
ncbi:MAG TPA: phenylalanine--tRNA ligase subunit beta [Nitrososphaeraceae archaeon]|nr:phenylalanine--tRNA ligase subunit beta [Nitrososphaeraceae archaeon]